MREIKFRQWLSIHKVMHYGIGASAKDYWAGPPSVIYDRDPLMQYTGLKDRNGKEIYEDDIIKHKEWGYTNQMVSVVRYYDGGFDPFSDNQDNCPYPEPSECEIIGNIHENHELLED